MDHKYYIALAAAARAHARAEVESGSPVYAQEYLAAAEAALRCAKLAAVLNDTYGE